MKRMLLVGLATVFFLVGIVRVASAFQINYLSDTLGYQTSNSGFNIDYTISAASACWVSLDPIYNDNGTVTGQLHQFAESSPVNYSFSYDSLFFNIEKSNEQEKSKFFVKISGDIETKSSSLSAQSNALIDGLYTSQSSIYSGQSFHVLTSESQYYQTLLHQEVESEIYGLNGLSAASDSFTTIIELDTENNYAHNIDLIYQSCTWLGSTKMIEFMSLSEYDLFETAFNNFHPAGQVSAKVNFSLEILEVGPVIPTPEPTTMLLFGTGLIGIAGITRRKK